MAVTAKNKGVLIEALRQRDRWTATLMTLVRHGAVSRRSATHKEVRSLEEDRSLSNLYPSALCGKRRGNTRESRQENLPVTGLADPRHMLKLAWCDAALALKSRRGFMDRQEHRVARRLQLSRLR
jgi:hypothetical protein